MSEQAIVPPDTAGWMVRVKTPPNMEEFWIAAFPDKADVPMTPARGIKASR